MDETKTVSWVADHKMKAKNISIYNSPHITNKMRLKTQSTHWDEYIALLDYTTQSPLKHTFIQNNVHSSLVNHEDVV